MALQLNSIHCIDCCRKSPIFELLRPKELKLIDDNRHEVVYNPGETIFKQGTACTHVLSFTSGLAKIHMAGLNGKNLIIRLIKPIEFITGAGLFTNNARIIFKAYEILEVGGVIAGDVPTYRIDPMPYGGIKNSGSGREGVRFAIEEMTEPKLLVINVQ